MAEFKSKVFKKFKGKCAYCGNDITIGNMTIDHINPKSNGGSLALHNCFPACLRCNSIKADGTVEEMRNKIIYSMNEIMSNKHFQMARKYKLVSIESKEIKFYFEHKNE